MRILIEKDLEFEASDGTRFLADVYRPESREPLPTLVQRTPYNKEHGRVLNFAIDVVRAARAGYALVVQDTRGRFGSGGQFWPFVREASDGHEAVEWAARQPWSSGKVGMVGGSYFGSLQWGTAAEAPGSLRAISPMFAVANYYDDWVYQGGAFCLGFNVGWGLRLAIADTQRRIDEGVVAASVRDELFSAIDRDDTLVRLDPREMRREVSNFAPYVEEWLDHPHYDAYWRSLWSDERYGDVAAASMSIGGWFDLFLGGTLSTYGRMRARRTGGPPARLVVGPWAHGLTGEALADRRYGVAAGADALDLTGVQLRWFDHLLKGLDNGADRDHPVKVFVMGANVWRDEQDWPLPGTIFTDLYLHSHGRASGSEDGALSPEPPGDEPPDVFLYDPHDPVPTVGGSYLPGLVVLCDAGPRDQRRLEGRDDVLCYTSEPLRSPVEVIGPVEVVLYFSSSAPDTDVTAKLVDVWPDGRADVVTEGIRRLRYRDGPDPVLMRAGTVYEARVDLWGTAIVFAEGHRIRLDISSSNFPRFDRNPNTGREVAADRASDLVVAKNAIHHSARHPSMIVLPVIERDGRAGLVASLAP